MELDFSEQIKNLNILSAELQTKNDYPEMAMKNKDAMKAQSFKVEIEKEEEDEGEDEEDEGEDEDGNKKKKEDEDEDEMEEESEAAKKAKKELEEKEKQNKFPFNKSKASFAEKVSRMLETKIELHNQKFEQNISFAQVSKVYSRGLNVFNSTHKPGISLHQWAIARVNLFLKMMSGGNVSSKYILLDSDIAKASSEISESGLSSYDYIDFSDLEFQLAKISLLEAGISESEMNLQISESEEKKTKL
jgi:hypothetical protein